MPYRTKVDKIIVIIADILFVKFNSNKAITAKITYITAENPIRKTQSIGLSFEFIISILNTAMAINTAILTNKINTAPLAVQFKSFKYFISIFF
jgi:hypothetical protein